MSCYHRKSFVWCLWFVYLLQSRKAENCLFQTVCELWIHCNCSSLAFSPQKRLRGFVFLGYLGPASLELLCFFPQSSLWRCIRPLLIPFAASSTYLESEGNSVADILISWVNIPWACLSVSLHVCVCAHARVCVLQTLTSAKTGRASTTRRVYEALALSPVCVSRVTLVSCVRQVSGGKVGIILQRKYFLLLSTSNWVFWQMLLSKELPSLPRQMGYGWMDLQTNWFFLWGGRKFTKVTSASKPKTFFY